MRKVLEKVAAFHVKHNFPVGIRAGDDPKTDLVRGHLIAEELGEFILALANKNYVKMADALGDLAYVVYGAAVTYGIPLQEVFDEIHYSNMTKAPRHPDDTRLRDKGESYVPPNIPLAIGRGLALNEKGRPKVVCLCGSTRFKDEFVEANRLLTLAGHIVLSVGMFGHQEGIDMGGEVKRNLDELHKRKIDISDEVFVINKGGYIGDSTRSEILYAAARGVPVKYMEPMEGVL